MIDSVENRKICSDEICKFGNKTNGIILFPVAYPCVSTIIGSAWSQAYWSTAGNKNGFRHCWLPLHRQRHHNYTQPRMFMRKYSDIYIRGKYHKISKTRRTIVGDKNVYHSDIVWASSVGAAPTTSSFSTEQLASKDCIKTTTRHDEKHLSLGIRCVLY